jgi:hypothetical protein
MSFADKRRFLRSQFALMIGPLILLFAAGENHHPVLLGHIALGLALILIVNQLALLPRTDV